MDKELSNLFIDEKGDLKEFIIPIEAFRELLETIPYEAFRDLTPKMPNLNYFTRPERLSLNSQLSVSERLRNYDESKDKLFYIIDGQRVPAWKVEANPQRYFGGEK